MQDDLIKRLQKPLEAHEIEFRVQQVSPKGWALLLAYKDARCDQNRLDEVVGPMKWKREHARDNRNCIVSIWDDEAKHWVSKEDTGTASTNEAEKGLASDSFKRACFNWGIGRELYDYPQMWVQLNQKEFYTYTKKVDGKDKEFASTTWDFKLKEWMWQNEFDGHGNLIYLEGRDQNGTRFYWGNKKAA